MKDNKNIVEQAENSASKIGKFNTADDLLAAYNALEGEFTKRCQLIKQLQAELEQALSAQASEPPETAQPAQTAPADDASVEAPADMPTEKASTVDTPIVAGPPEAERTADVPSEQSPSERPETVEVAVAAAGSVDLDALADAVVGEVARNAAAYAEALCVLPEIMDACVARYKQRLIETRVSPSPSGVAVIAPVARPRTLADAKILADRLISKA